MTDDRGSTRRRLLGGLGALGGAMTVARAPLGAWMDLPGDLHFLVSRDGAEIGRHEVRFTQRGERLQVDIEIRFDVSFGFIPLYRYRHRNREVWRGDRLVELETRTDDDGTPHRMRARAEGDRLIVQSSTGRLELPGDTGSTSYWNEAKLKDGAWLDTQSGRLVRSRVSAHAPEPIRAAGRVVMAKRYVLEGDVDCELWYHEGRWVGLGFQLSDGSTISYELGV